MFLAGPGGQDLGAQAGVGARGVVGWGRDVWRRGDLVVIFMVRTLTRPARQHKPPLATDWVPGLRFMRMSGLWP
jgi:hypothetical protein